jgi:hypothetical protein
MNRRGYCIFIDTVCEGAVPRVRGTTAEDAVDAPEGICLFRTELEAQREIADAMMTRLEEFLDGERDFEDAISVEEYVVEVELGPDGVVVDRLR